MGASLDPILQMGKLSLQEIKHLTPGGVQLGSGRPRLETQVIWLQSELLTSGLHCRVSESTLLLLLIIIAVY